MPTGDIRSRRSAGRRMSR